MLFSFARSSPQSTDMSLLVKKQCSFMPKYSFQMDELASSVLMISCMIREQRKRGDRCGVMKSDEAHGRLHWRHCANERPACYRCFGAGCAQYLRRRQVRGQSLRLNDAGQAAARRAFPGVRAARSRMLPESVCHFGACRERHSTACGYRATAVDHAFGEAAS